MVRRTAALQLTLDGYARQEGPLPQPAVTTDHFSLFAHGRRKPARFGGRRSGLTCGGLCGWTSRTQPIYPLPQPPRLESGGFEA